MSEENMVNEEVKKSGSINISNDVVSIVASLAASSVKGVSGMVSSISGGIAELLGKKNMSKGVKVSVSDKDVTLDLSIIVEYGAKIPDVAWEIQEKVKSEVEAMTGLTVVAVNVSVEGVVEGVNVPKADGDKTPPQTVGEKVEEKLGDIAEAASDMVEDAAEAVSEKVDDAIDFAAEVKEKIEDKIEENLDESPEEETE